MESNFEFLRKDFPVLANFGSLAEKYVFDDANSCLMKLGMIGETIANLMFAYDKLPFPEENTAVKRIDVLLQEGLVTKDLADIMHALRKMRNKAAHENYSNSKVAKTLLEMAYSLCEWFMEVYGDCDYKHKNFVMPSDTSTELAPNPANPAPKVIRIAKQTKEATKTESDNEIKQINEAVKTAEAIPAISSKERKEKVRKAASNRYKSEAEARYIIDEQLRKVGWEADTEQLRHSLGTRPQKGRNMAIAEWPTISKNGQKGFADYALFVSLKLVGLIEAKSAHKDISAIIDNQCKEYAKNIRDEDKIYQIGDWNDYKVPFVFATNGREYIKQFETQSGIWFLDLRDDKNLPKALHGWVSPIGVKDMLEANTEKANVSLKNMPYDLLKQKDGLNFRPYQLEAVKAAEYAIINGKRSALLAMATGTGKTRTVLGMIYRFLKSGRFKRILFLVDRTSLGEQANDVFKEVRLEELLTLDKIYNIKGLEDKTIDSETRIHISTVQSMVKRILYSDDEDDGTGKGSMPSVSDYDLLIIDEAHRGYILDREMGEAESLFSDQRDYQSKYRAVIEYFDAVKIALTATPALQTTEIFGNPVFKYTYREAVIDGYLSDHDAPHNIKTKLRNEGIRYNKGDTITIFDPVTGEIKNAENISDEIDFDIDSFNSKVVVESFNKTVLAEIAKDLSPNNPEEKGKTLIYAVNDRHADLIVKILREIYLTSNLPNEAIMKITGSIGDKTRVQEAIKRFKNERFPSIAVTVDLLTTGIDVPSITTLVFMRRVKSRILFEQMLGRATRLCPQIHKTHFEIYDPVGVYESLQDFNTMKPVAVNPKIPYSKLFEQLSSAEDEKHIEFQINQIVAKLQRNKNDLETETLNQFKSLTNGKTPAEFIAQIKALKPAEAKEALLASSEIFKLLQRTQKYTPLVISDAPDSLMEHTREYAYGEKPEDYLDAFTNYIKTNMNEITALKIVCTKPRELTRDSLKKLSVTLDNDGYAIKQLNLAVSKMTNKEIAADIISLVRRYGIGSELISHEERIKKAVDKLRNAHKFSETELKWLNRIETYLMEETVINADVFNTDSRFKSYGGFGKLNKAFNNRLNDLINELNEYLYDDSTATAA